MSQPQKLALDGLEHAENESSCYHLKLFNFWNDLR